MSASKEQKSKKVIPAASKDELEQKGLSNASDKLSAALINQLQVSVPKSKKKPEVDTWQTNEEKRMDLLEKWDELYDKCSGFHELIHYPKKVFRVNVVRKPVAAVEPVVAIVPEVEEVVILPKIKNKRKLAEIVSNLHPQEEEKKKEQVPAESGKQKCNQCEEDVDLSLFYSTGGKTRKICKPCSRENEKERYQKRKLIDV